MIKQAKWIRAPFEIGTTAPEFFKAFTLKRKVKKAIAEVSALGVFECRVNGKRTSDAVLAPGWTDYYHRVQSERYDITDLLTEGENTFSVYAGNGWAAGAIGFMPTRNYTDHISVIAGITLTYEDGATERFGTDGTFSVYEGTVRFSELYDGERQDLCAVRRLVGAAQIDKEKKPKIIARVGEEVRERERVAAKELIVTPKGERVIDFGQNLAGYPEIRIKGKRGEHVSFSFAEVLDKDGNFYTENYRTAKSKLEYTLSGNEDLLKPKFTFFGYRYLRLDEYPETVDLSGFVSVAVYSDMKRIGFFSCGEEKINRLYQNILWGQRSNFLDVPTDCPQRDERLGWLGDAQVFCRTASLNYDTERFYRKWLGDMALGQKPDGALEGIAPTLKKLFVRFSAAWADAGTICPFEVYLAFGNKELLAENFPMMKKWVDYMHGAGPEEFLWLGGEHFGDWLAMDAGPGTYTGATYPDMIASAFFAYSTELVVRAGHILGVDVTAYEALHAKVRAAFRAAFMKDGMPAAYPKLLADEKEREEKHFGKGVNAHFAAVTQTSLTLILRFGLYDPCEKDGLITKLVNMIKENGGRMTTGFVGTPYILHVLSENGHADVAYDLLFAEGVPSWLFSVGHGATTMWEHWDGIREDGSFWSSDMNSYNHYAYGAVYDWIYGVALGITVPDDGAGYRKIRVAPHPDRRLGFAEGGIESRHGRVSSSWHIFDREIRYEIAVPAGVEAEITLPGEAPLSVTGGTYLFVRPVSEKTESGRFR